MGEMEEQTAIFRLLDHRGVKLQRFAELIGYSYDYIAAIRSGRRPMTDEFRSRCVAYFQMPEDLLFGAQVVTQVRDERPDAPPATPAGAQATSADADVSHDPETAGEALERSSDESEKREGEAA